MAKEYIELERAKEHLVGDYAYAAAKMLDDIPTADVVEVKHGYWKEPKGGGYQCSNCRAFFDDYYGFSAKEKCFYCPICGAKMDLKERK